MSDRLILCSCSCAIASIKLGICTYDPMLGQLLIPWTVVAACTPSPRCTCAQCSPGTCVYATGWNLTDSTGTVLAGSCKIPTSGTTCGTDYTFDCAASPATDTANFSGITTAFPEDCSVCSINVYAKCGSQSLCWGSSGTAQDFQEYKLCADVLLLVP